MANAMYRPHYDQSWAVVVGINAYEYERKLDFAVNDADVFARTLIDRFGFPKTNVTLMLDGDASLVNIQHALHSLVQSADHDAAWGGIPLPPPMFVAPTREVYR